MNCIHDPGIQFIRRDQDTEALGHEGFRVQDLVAAAAHCQRNQDVGDLQRQDLTDGIGAGAGDDQICGGEQVAQILFGSTIAF